MHITLMICYARSGGTLFNKCVGSMDDIIMLSEVNPLGGGWGKRRENSYTTPAEQANNWFNLNINKGTYLEEISQIFEYCKANGKYLVIRDWSYINFNYSERVDQSSIPNQLLNYEMLKDLYPLKTFAYVRDSIDVMLSMGYSRSKSESYFNYVDNLKEENISYFKYEDFCKKPVITIKNVCETVEIPFDQQFIDKMHSYNKINGDIQSPNSRLNKEKIEIKLKERKAATDSKIRKINNDEYLKAANSILNYSTNYYKNWFKKYFKMFR